MSIIRLENISKSYRLQNDSPMRVVLDHIDLSLIEGDSIAITGPSGAGKSTLLNIMGCIDKADSGNIWFHDRDISSVRLDQLAALRNQHIGFVFQQHHLLPQLTLMENVLLPLLEEKNKEVKGRALKRALELIEWTGLENLKDQYPWQLSGGELQRAAVVRAMIHQPDLVLADEPTGSLDEENARILVDLLLKINQEKRIAVVMVTHAIDLAEKMQTHYRLSNGSLVKMK